MDDFALPTISERFEIKKVLGQGGMGFVLDAFDNRLKRPCAIKVIKKEYRDNSEVLTRFRSEAELTANLNHPNIIQIYDISTDEKIPYFVMEKFSTSNLQNFVEGEKNFSMYRLLPICIQIIKGLRAAHKKGLLHRDVKPENILIDEEDNIKIIDFGLARIFLQADATRFTRTGMVLGTPQFMSPEQWAAKKDLTFKTDIYSAGASFFYLFSGHAPVIGQKFSDFIRNKDGDTKLKVTAINRLKSYGVALLSLLQKMMAFKPDNRPDYDSVLLSLNQLFMSQNGLAGQDAATKEHATQQITNAKEGRFAKICLQISEGPYKGSSFSFEKPGEIHFGRASSLDVNLALDKKVSSRHFMLLIDPPRFVARDLGSKNGTYVNEVRYGGRKDAGPDVKQAKDGKVEVELQDGDELRVGNTRFKIKITAKVIETISSIEAVLNCEKCGRALNESNTAALTTRICDTCKEKQGNFDLRLLRELLVAENKKGKVAGAPDIPGFEVIQELGRGGMGVVYKAVQKETGKTVAIKTLIPTMQANERKIRIFLREVDLTRQLLHPNIVELFESGELDGSFYFVLEFVDGMDLEQFIQKRRQPLNWQLASELMLGTLEGLAFAHNVELEIKLPSEKSQKFHGLVHRDLKPQNVLLASLGSDKWLPKVADFGLSKSFESAGMTDLTMPGQVGGTPLYWPREQISHYRYLHPPTDVFSIAAVFYEMLTGQMIREGFEDMFERVENQGRRPGLHDYVRVLGKNPTIPILDRRKDIPPAIAAVIDRALKEIDVPPDVEKMKKALAELRYPDAGAFHQALLQALKSSGLK
ncbi:protein kinase [Candidatus Riflebacteria bacterium]